MERKTCTEKNSYKKWCWKEDDTEEKEKTLVGGKILEVG